MSDSQPTPHPLIPAAAALLAALAALAGLLAAAGCGAGPAASATARVERGRFDVCVTENCEFKPLNSWVVLAQASDQIDWLLAEGATVQPGDLVFTQDRTSEREWLTRDSNELEAARRNLAEVRRQVQMEMDELNLGLRSCESTVELAATQVAELLAGPGEQALEEYRAALRAAAAQAEDRRSTADAAAELAAEGFLSEAEAATERLAAEIADIEHRRRKLELEVLQAGAATEDRKISELQLERAKVELAMARADADRRRAELSGRITDAEARVASLERNVARARRSIASREVRAGGAGVIIYRNLRWRGRGKPEVGSRVWTGAGVVDIADVTRMKVRTQLAERYIRHLKVGSKIRVKPTPLPGTVLEARVIWIDRWSRDRSADLAKADRAKQGLSGVKAFALEAAVEGSDQRIKPGFKGTAEFPLQTIPDALIVPLSVLCGSIHERYVLAADGRRVSRVPVEVLAEDGTRAAVRGDLRPGQNLFRKGTW
jgi:multidrug resistance efflux pump